MSNVGRILIALVLGLLLGIGSAALGANWVERGTAIAEPAIRSATIAAKTQKADAVLITPVPPHLRAPEIRQHETVFLFAWAIKWTE